MIGTTPGSRVTTNYATSGWDVSNSYSLGGGINGNNQFTLNGANVTSQFGYDNHSPGEWTVSPNIDSIEEVNIMTNTYDARFGRTSYFIYWKGEQFRSTNGLNGLAAHGNINWVHQSVVATQDVTHVFSPTFTGDFKIAYDRFFSRTPDGDLTQQTAPSAIGLTMPLPGSVSTNYLPEFNVSDARRAALLRLYLALG